MKTYTFKFKKISKYSDEIERTTVIKANCENDAMVVFRGNFGNASRTEVISIKDEKGNELLKK